MRVSSELSYRSRVNAVVEHIAANLAEPLDGPVLARQAALSPFHFHRVFHELTGLTPAEYVEYVRLGTAIVRLQQSDLAVSRVAESVGYETGTSLAKALRRRFGLVPSALRDMQDGESFRHRLDLSAFVRPKPASRLHPRFTHLPPQLVLCASARGMANHQAHEAYNRAENLLMNEAERLGLAPYVKSKLALIVDAPANPNDANFRIVAGLLIDKPGLPRETDPGRAYFEIIGGGNYAVFRHLGARETHWQSWFSIFHNWVPSVATLVRPGLPFQCAVALEAGSSTPLVTDFYLPVV